MAEPVDGKLHISERDFDVFVEQIHRLSAKITDGNRLLIFVRFGEQRARDLALAILVELAPADLMIGGVQPVRRRPTAEELFSGRVT